MSKHKNGADHKAQHKKDQRRQEREANRRKAPPMSYLPR